MRVFTPNKNKMNRVEQIASELAADITSYVCGVKQSPINKYAPSMRRCAGEMLIKHQYLFNGMVKKLDINMENITLIFPTVVENMLEDGAINWGRIVSVYAFAGRLAQHMDSQGNAHTQHIVGKVSSVCGSVLADKLADWIEQQGGWDAFLEHFPGEDPAAERRVWGGLLMTAAMGLGLLATMVASRG